MKEGENASSIFYIWHQRPCVQSAVFWYKFICHMLDTRQIKQIHLSLKTINKTIHKNAIQIQSKSQFWDMKSHYKINIYHWNYNKSFFYWHGNRSLSLCSSQIAEKINGFKYKIWSHIVIFKAAVTIKSQLWDIKSHCKTDIYFCNYDEVCNCNK